MPRTQTKLTNGSRPAEPDAVEAADTTVMRLFADIDLARTVEQMVKHGSLDRDLLAEAQDFEQKAWGHLAAYLAATAFADL
jgi:hypothetical protein